jgi:hypothetical protein
MGVNARERVVIRDMADRTVGREQDRHALFRVMASMGMTFVSQTLN